MSNIRKPLIITLAFLFFSVTVSAQNADRNKARSAGQRTQRPAAVKPTRANVAYGPHERNRIDFYQAKSEQATPLALYIHGGGFRGGSKQGINQHTLQQLLDAGISVAAIEYRLVPEFPLPTAHQDESHQAKGQKRKLRYAAEIWNPKKQTTIDFTHDPIIDHC